MKWCMESEGTMELQNDIPKYRKKKSQESKSEKRSDHKHQYVKSIKIVSYREGTVNWIHWSKHCSICGRQGGKANDCFNDRDFKLPQFQTEPYIRILGHYMSYDDICKKFPDVPIYRNNPDDLFGEDVRLR